MPKNGPINPDLRQAIRVDIVNGRGRNEIARNRGVSPGLVSKIARENYLHFANIQTANATDSRQIDQWAARVERHEKLFDEYFEIKPRQDGSITRRERQLMYLLYDVERHHNGRYTDRVTDQ